jgi:DNA-binding LacI/PurR family transcriptional regulator
MTVGARQDTRNRATLRDVADEAGVSTATVSHALRNTGKMSEVTRERVRLTAARLDYRPNHLAASLRRQSTRTIGFVVVPNPDSGSQQRWASSSAEQLYSLVAEASKRGFSVTAIPENAPNLVESSRIDALCFFDIRDDVPALREAVRLGIPILTNDVADSRFDVVVDCGFATFSTQALTLLSARKDSIVGLLSQPRGMPRGAIAERVYRQWCAAHQTPAIVAHGTFDHSDVAERVGQLIDAGCNAIYSCNEAGPEMVTAITDRGLSIPEDVRLVATATLNTMTAASAGITTIVYHPELAAPHSFDSLIDAIQNPAIPRAIALPWELIESTSTAG